MKAISCDLRNAMLHHNVPISVAVVWVVTDVATLGSSDAARKQSRVCRSTHEAFHGARSSDTASRHPHPTRRIVARWKEQERTSPLGL